MLDLELPQITKTTTRGHHGCYLIGPVEAACSTTLASALRRVLLSSLEGAAITSLSIEGVLHEFQDIPNVKEDVTDLVQNIKKVRLRSYTDRPVTMRLQASGEGMVFAGDIKTPSTSIKTKALGLPDQRCAIATPPHKDILHAALVAFHIDFWTLR